jgi:hypothetical protein
VLKHLKSFHVGEIERHKESEIDNDMKELDTSIAGPSSASDPVLVLEYSDSSL